MDVGFWACRVQSANQHSAMQAARHNAETHLSMDDFEGDDDICSCFPCPFCYVDIEVPVLRIHLQEEHCFDVKNAVCPVCAGNLGKDMIGHFTVQHSHLLKRRRKSQRMGAAVVGKDLRELSSFLGVASTNGRGNAPDSAPDPLLSPFLYGLAPPHATTVNQDTSSVVNAMVDSFSSEVQREPTTPNGARGQQADEERNQRAVFVQHLLVSTIF
ncbi:protein DEHYDRATION-INDUCED 19 homolog 6-like [Magnolia sinica]|uniref:protein DEHYDRATION-INDUCED 19 homolog 6-like n=1 Tax=Magnolia sinica TaxID=86752 RepID=UPI00265ADB4B|nr:protein DEHYDRATION-INDUCED 19 homolog 6-like [Magnolia sinica]